MKYLVYAAKIVVYLTFDEYDKNSVYSYYLNDKLWAEGNITNYTFDKLIANTVHHVKVLRDNKVLFEEKIRTLPIRKAIKVEVSDNTGTKVVTKEVQRYLDMADKTNKIVFPKGTYLCGALFVRSGTEIYLEKDAVIKGSIKAEDYLPKIKSRFEGYEVMAYASLINIGELDHTKEATTHNIIIHGEGTIYGGDRELRFDMLEKEKDHPIINDRWRNRLINISNCSNVVIDGLKLGHSASWNVHPTYSDHIYIHHCDVKSGGLPNGDGIDPDSCHDMDIFANTFFVGDDCVAIKSGKNPEGNIINIPCYNLSIFDCVSNGSHGCAIGSEISGGVYNVDIFNCDFVHSYFGVHIKTTLKRGGYVKNVRVKHCKASSIYIHLVDYNDDGESAKTITEFSNFSFEDIAVTGVAIKPDNKIFNQNHILVDGFKDYPLFKDMSFKDITVIKNNDEEERIQITNAVNCVIHNLSYEEE